MTTFIFEISTPTFFKAVEYRSRKKTLNNIQKELTAWADDTIRYFDLETVNISYGAHTYDHGKHLLKV